MNIAWVTNRGQMEMMQGELHGIRQQAQDWRVEADSALQDAADRERGAAEDASEARRLTLLMSRLLGAAGMAGSSHRDINDLIHAMMVSRRCFCLRCWNFLHLEG